MNRTQIASIEWDDESHYLTRLGDLERDYRNRLEEAAQAELDGDLETQDAALFEAGRFLEQVNWFRRHFGIKERTAEAAR